MPLLNIIFRTDASLRIGSGHAMRCLTLADGLRQQGAECRFITRDLPGHLAERITSRGFACRLLPEPGGGAPPKAPPAYASWAEVSWQQDAIETRNALADGPPPDWLVLDHYAFDRRWEEAVLPPACKLLVIDDLADRPHIADMLVDQNLGRDAADYDGLLPETCERLVGPRFALLRPEFAELRPSALAARAERASNGIKHLLISLGGVDQQNATAAILRSLPSCQLPADVHVKIVMGRSAPWLSEVRQLAAALPWSHDVLVNVTDMASLMAEADLAIGAAGATSWERCCLGLPSIVLPISDNQKGIAMALVETGAALSPGELASEEFSARLGSLIAGLADADFLATVATSASQHCDGDGVARVFGRMTPRQIHIRDSMRSDSRRIWEW